jgi:predicted transport protein
MEIKKQRVTLFLKLDPKTVAKPPKNSRDVSEIGHYGTGDFEIVLESEQDAAAAFPFIRAAYNEIGG